ncbi:MAG TPA: 8-amino-7-oxononanoate synthase [Myxococcota bacterium]|nr:8-amino-7-oxononanoate synthase [Myxococcota bacterium]
MENPLSFQPVAVRTQLDDALAAELEELRRRTLHRRLRSVSGRQAARMTVDGRECLMLAGSNYLDLAADARVVDAARDAAQAYGAAAGGSRLINGNLDLHEALERELAAFAGHEAALVFSTGYMANLGVLTALCGPGDVIVSDALNHASIVDACRLARAETRVFAHNDPADFARVAGGLAGFRRRVLVVDGVYSMDGDVARLAELVPIARAHDMVVVLDDAHGLGVLGAHGRGVASLTGVTVDVLIGNLGKSLGSFGAFVAGSLLLREYLVNTARSFIFTCALAPPALGAARGALAVARAEPERRKLLLERAEQLRAGLQSLGWNTLRSTTQIVPALVGENAATLRVSDQLLARGIYAQGIRHPSVPHGSARIRLTPTCAHSLDDVARVVAAFAEIVP